MTINYQYPYQTPVPGPQNPYINPQPNLYPPYQAPYQPPFNVPIPGYVEQSYIENILRLNKGKIASVYMSFESSQWGSKIFKGEILEAGKDHLILRDSQNGIIYLLLTIYLSYITFDDNIEYDYPFDNQP